MNVSLTLMIFFSMVSCEKENVNGPMMDEPVRVTNAEMQRAAEVVAEAEVRLLLPEVLL